MPVDDRATATQSARGTSTDAPWMALVTAPVSVSTAVVIAMPKIAASAALAARRGCARSERPSERPTSPIPPFIMRLG
jgi:hypothetical protein